MAGTEAGGAVEMEESWDSSRHRGGERGSKRGARNRDGRRNRGQVR